MPARRSLGAPRRRPQVLGLAALVIAATSLVGPFGTRPSTAQPVPAPGPADLAARWLGGEVSDGTITTGGVPDPGLAADAALALTATGRQPGPVDRLARRLLDRPDDTVRPAGAGQVLAGGTAKLVLLAVARGDDPRAVDGADLVDLLRSRRVDAPGAVDDGRLRDLPPAAAPTLADRSNTFTQALGVLALTRAGTSPGSAVAFLVAQQCPSGGFRLFLTGGRGCTTDASADVDTTALSVFALGQVSGTTDPVVDRALDWLEQVQQSDGSLRSSGPGAVANANSTGLAAAAFAVGGRPEAAARARAWVVARQLGCGAGSADVGAVAFTTGAQTAASTGIPATARDQFRRSTSQALLAFATVPIGSSGTPVPEPGTPCGTPTATSTVPTTTIPTSTIPTSTVPAGTVPTSTIPASTVPTPDAPTVLGAIDTRQVVGAIDTRQVVGGADTRQVVGSSGSTGTRLAVTGGSPLGGAVIGLGLLLVGLVAVGVARGRTGPQGRRR